MKALVRHYAWRLRKQSIFGVFCPMISRALEYYIKELEEKYWSKLSEKEREELRRYKGLILHRRWGEKIPKTERILDLFLIRYD